MLNIHKIILLDAHTLSKKNQFLFISIKLMQTYNLKTLLYDKFFHF